MKIYVEHKILLIFFFLSLTLYHPLFGQEKINVLAGFGFPEYLHLGARYCLTQTQFGLSVGTLPTPDKEYFAISGDVLLHFGGTSQFSTRRPWYLRTGLSYYKFKSKFINSFSFITGSYTFYNLRMGREINLSEKIGLQMDIGLAFDLSKRPQQKSSYDLDFSVFPGLGAALFYRLY